MIYCKHAILYIKSELPHLQDYFDENDSIYCQLSSFADYTDDVIRNANKKEFMAICKVITHLLLTSKNNLEEKQLWNARLCP